jgi:autotransporter adhesin
MAAAFGGGAAYQGASWIAPTYQIQGTSYANVGDAFGAVDGALSGALLTLGQLQQRIDNMNGGVDGGIPAGDGNGLAIGDGSVATDGRDTSIGNGATVGADGSTALGSNATISATATNAVAVGADSNVTAASGTALGQAASATGENSVALGANSVADQANTVSIGSATNQRRITNMAAGTAATDGANVGQVNEALETARTYADAGDSRTLAAANAYTDSKLGVSQSDFDSFRNQVNDKFSDVNRRLDRVGAMGTAMAQMTANTSGLAGENRIGAGAGSYGGQTAISVGYQHAFSANRASVSVGAAMSGSESTVGVGGGFSW